MPIPNLFIVGSWKAGTSSLYHYLNAHPDVYMSPVKEPHFFVHHTQFRPRIFCLKSSYLRLFRKAGDAKVIGEASAYYFSMPESAKMIHDFNPDAKIVIILRHPVDTIYAFHSENIFVGREKRDFATAIAYNKTHPDHAPNYLELIRCWPQRIQAYQDLFGKENVHIILFEDLANNTLTMYRELLKFLNVNLDFQPVFEIHNPSKIPTSRMFAWISANPLTILAMQACCTSALLAEKINEFRKKKLIIRPREPLDSTLRKELAIAFTPTVNVLSSLLQKNLSSWKE